MKPRALYLILCGVGALLPYSQFLRAATPGAGSILEQLFANRISGFFAMDVLASAVAFGVFSAIESRRAGLRGRWLAMVALLLVGVSLALPLFLYLREKQIRSLG